MYKYGYECMGMSTSRSVSVSMSMSKSMSVRMSMSEGMSMCIRCVSYPN